MSGAPRMDISQSAKLVWPSIDDTPDIRHARERPEPIRATSFPARPVARAVCTASVTNGAAPRAEFAGPPRDEAQRASSQRAEARYATSLSAVGP